MKASELRKKFLTNNALELLEEYEHKRRTNQWTNEDGCPIVRERMWNMLIDIIMSAKDIENVDATNAAEIVELMKEGKLDIDGAERLMKIFKTQAEIVELTEGPKNAGQVPSVIFNIKQDEYGKCTSKGSSGGDGSSEVDSEEVSSGTDSTEES